MSDSNLVEWLRDIHTMLGEVKKDTAEIRIRIGMLEARHASVSRRLDRMARVLLALANAPPT
jgi:hypothetical protein